jgi:hypothetical protein
MLKQLSEERNRLHRAEQACRDAEQRQERRLDEWWSETRREFTAAMRSAGYHNPNGRGWRKARIGKQPTTPERGEGGTDAE